MFFLHKNRQIILNQLTSKLYPLIYQGLSSIYQEAVNISKNEPKTILKNFQIFLKKIPSWNSQMIEEEKRRILLKIEEPDVVDLLIKSFLKLTLIQLTSYSEKSLLKLEIMNELNINDFIHQIYIKIARELYSNPFLMYDKLSSIEVKKNQCLVLDIIKKSIEETILDLLPWEEISTRILELPEIDFLKSTPNYPQFQMGGNILPIEPENKQQLDQPKADINEPIEQPKQEENNYNQEILDIIENVTKPTEITDNNKISDNKEENKTKPISEEKSDEKLEKKLDVKSDGKPEGKPEEKPEEKVVDLNGGKSGSSSIKNLMKDLNESDTSIVHIPASEDGFSGYADVFTNKNINTEEKTKKLGKNKFFANFLKV